jgi:hypothetical protein
MPLAVDVFWSFRLPTPSRHAAAVRLAAEYDVDVNVRAALPIAVRTPGFFDTVNPLWPPYLLRDTMRIASTSASCVPGRRPDPIVQEFPREVAVEQPTSID